MASVPPIKSKASVALDLPPSCILFSPAHPDFFMVGTYNLRKDGTSAPHSDADEETEGSKKLQSRTGSLVVFRLHGDDLLKVQTSPQPSALLDLRFHPDLGGYQDILAVVSSTGTLAIFKFDPMQDATSPLSHLATSSCADLDDGTLFLQCAWHPILTHAIAVTTSTGLARLLYLDSEWKIRGHADLDVPNTLEAWSIAFSPPLSPDSHAVSAYCGGDDSMLRYTSHSVGDGDSADGIEALFSPVMIKGQHGAGVTAILPLPLFADDGGRIVITGSYDDILRVFSIHDLNASHGAKRIRLLAEENLGGGVWRLNLVDMKSPRAIRVLASCMHAGARVVEVSSEEGSSWGCRILARFEEHKSMNYASDFVALPGVNAGLRCVSTSFYDKLLCLWDYREEHTAEAALEPI